VKGDYKSWKLKVNLGLLTGVEDLEVYYYSEEFEVGCWYYDEDGKPTIVVEDMPEDDVPAENE
jgi:hypothetical protein